MNIFYAGGQGVKEIFSMKESEGQINIFYAVGQRVK